jgi:DedD protein
MDEGAKRRLAGAAVLVALVVIFVPMLLDDDESDGLGEPILIPDAPEVDVTDVEDEQELAPLLPEPETASGAATEPAPLPVPSPPIESADRAADAGPEPSPVAPDRAPSPAASGPKPVPPGAAAWVVQVASVTAQGPARKLRDELRGKGYAAFIEEAMVNGKRYYRIRVGPETDRGTADGVANRIQRETGAKPLVQSWR